MFSPASEETANVAGEDKSKKFIFSICFQLLTCLVRSVAGPGGFSGVSDFSQRSTVCIPAGCMPAALGPANWGQGKGCQPRARGAGGHPQPVTAEGMPWCWHA